MVAEGAAAQTGPTPEPEGAKGVGLPVRGHLRFLQARLAKSEEAMGEDWCQAVRFCRAIQADEKASARDRLRASELLTSLVDRGIGVAESLDKMDRLDNNKPTENHIVKFIRGIDPEAL